ncbi:hypothetical protein BGZ83_009917 [Gryganskiella cystojenkinii]|nr:hypothetical protein BGZ83_009917 [Gryganskiella cystojenkinii]
MNLPEIRHNVSHYLLPHDLTQCVQVSKEWYHSFAPMIYCSLNLPHGRPVAAEPSNLLDKTGETRQDDIQDRIEGESPRVPSPTTLRRYGAHARRLLVSLPCPLLQHVAPVAQNLSSFGIDAQYMFSELDGDIPGNTRHSDFEVLGQLLVQNPNLRRLGLRKIEGIISSEASTLLRKVGPGCVEADLFYLTLDLQDLVQFLEQCPHLSTVVVAHCTITDMRADRPVQSPSHGSASAHAMMLNTTFIATPTVPLFQEITYLRLEKIRGLDFQGVLDIASRCPRLATLSVQPFVEGLLETPADFTLLKRCPRLSSLSILDLYLDDDELATLLNNCSGDGSSDSDDSGRGLKFLHLSLGRIGPKVLAAMSRHFESLKSLQAIGVKSEGWICSQILRSCPNLEIFTCPKLDVDNGFLTGSPGTPSAVRAAIATPLSTASLVDSQHQNHAPDCRPLQGSWASIRLRSLSVKTLWWSKDANLNQEALEQLSTLKDLQNLSMITFRRRTIEPEVYKADPTRYWSRGHYKRAQLQESPNLGWMADTWPHLQTFAIYVV